MTRALASLFNLSRCRSLLAGDAARRPATPVLIVCQQAPAFEPAALA